MDFIEQFENIEQNKHCGHAIELLPKFINSNPNNVEVYIKAIYLLHDFLLEQDCSDFEKNIMEKLLKTYFDAANKKFNDNAEYLFFVGKILYIAEWYFGVDDDLKPLHDKLAFKMQKKAFEKEPENVLFEWAYRFSLNDELAGYLAKQILLYDKTKIEWLNKKGFPGKYILESLQRSGEKYR